MAGSSRAKITRREFTGICAGAASMGTTMLEAGSHFCEVQETARSGLTNGIDQNPIRRRCTGLRGLDASRACPGLTLFAPLSGDGTVYLIHGSVVHT
jgi:hypothetical protein